MDKYTPGPWEAERHGAVVAEVAGRRRQVACAQGDAVMHGDTETDVIELQRANAQLIAAAPELLESLGDALEEMENDTCVECGQQWDECECPNGDWWRKARGAIAKAKGETK